MTVIQFPEKRKTEVTRNKLHDLADSLEEIYNNLERVYSMLHTLEQESDRLESEYNKIFREYLSEFEDHEDIELRLVNYCSEAVIVESEAGLLRVQLAEEKEWD